jgi:hypothetical protein
MRRTLRILFRIALFLAVVRGVAALVAKALEGSSDPDDDDFTLAAILDGRHAKSGSTELRRVTLASYAGGIDLDLSGATLASGGAHVDANIVGGGVRIAVPNNWRVYAVDDTVGGGVEIDTLDPDDLPDGSPTLTVAARVRGGGLLIQRA